MSRLSEALKLIEAGWCQGVQARDENGKETYIIKTGNPASYSILGALLKVCPTYREEMLAHDQLKRHIPWHWSLTDWNDAERRTKDDVINLFKKAIADESSR